MSDQGVGTLAAPEGDAASLPYIVSADIRRLLAIWAPQRGFSLPHQKYFEELREHFSLRMRLMFSTFELIGEDEISCGLEASLGKLSNPIVSLDRAYTKEGFYFLDFARTVDGLNQDAGLQPRPGKPSLGLQLQELKRHVDRPITLVDDVVFSGEGMATLIEELALVGISVAAVRTGICVGKGFRKISALVGDVACVRYYEDLLDEVCERDFYPGVPFSGRVLAGGCNVGVPYIKPFGDPEAWASVPAREADAFSAFCIRQTAALFKEIERVSGKAVLCRDLPRQVKGLPSDGSRFVEVLADLA